MGSAQSSPRPLALEVDFNISDIDISTLELSPFRRITSDQEILDRFLPTTQDEGVRFLERALAHNTPLIIRYKIYLCGKTGKVNREVRIMEDENQEKMLRGHIGDHSGTAMNLVLYYTGSETEESYWYGSFYTNGLLTADIRANIK